jgi:hypothetical protein
MREHDFWTAVGEEVSWAIDDHTDLGLQIPMDCANALSGAIGGPLTPPTLLALLQTGALDAVAARMGARLEVDAMPTAVVEDAVRGILARWPAHDW